MSKKLWGGRFEKEVDKDFFEFQKSIGYDYRLAEYDIYHSMIHIIALAKAEILTESEYTKLSDALGKVLAQIKGKDISFIKDVKESEDAEDVHTYIQKKVEENLAPKDKELILKLHSFRSRNDQIVFDEKYYCVIESLHVREQLLDLRDSILFIEEKYLSEHFIGYTHTQRAQSVSFINYMSAYFYMFGRDLDRLSNFFKSIGCYVGAGALTGTSLTKSNYDNAIKESGILEEESRIKLVKNSLDNVSDRDFVIEFLSILALIQMHLSRLAEDLILYSTKEFNFVVLPEEFCTGSSLMPHKKNPDFLELVRGYTGMIYGNLIAALTIMKGLPLTYNRDMQLDKEPLFSSVEKVIEELKIMTRFIKGVELNKKTIKQILKKDKSLYATELAEWLVKDERVPFKKAHDIAGRLTILIEKKGGNTDAISNKELKKLHPKLNKDVIRDKMNVKYAIGSKNTITTEVPIEDKKMNDRQTKVE